MDIIVCMKLVPDLKQVRIKRETREPMLEGVPLVWGDMDKNALEEAIRLREKNGGKVTVLALGAGKLKEAMVEALAMGADEGVILTDPLLAGCDSAAVAQALAAAIRKIGRFDLVLAAEGSTDNYSGQVGPRLAEELDLPQITFVRELAVAEGTADGNAHPGGRLRGRGLRPAGGGDRYAGDQHPAPPASHGHPQGFAQAAADVVGRGSGHGRAGAAGGAPRRAGSRAVPQEHHPGRRRRAGTAAGRPAREGVLG